MANNILTIAEALVALKRDSDLDGEVESLLKEVDAVLEQATGIKWQEQDPIPHYAKTVARLWLQLETGALTQQLHIDNYQKRLMQLKVMAVEISNIQG